MQTDRNTLDSRLSIKGRTKRHFFVRYQVSVLSIRRISKQVSVPPYCTTTYRSWGVWDFLERVYTYLHTHYRRIEKENSYDTSLHHPCVPFDFENPTNQSGSFVFPIVSFDREEPFVLEFTFGTRCELRKCIANGKKEAQSARSKLASRVSGRQ